MDHQQLSVYFYDRKIPEVSLLTTEYDVDKLETHYSKLLPFIPPDKPNIVNNLNVILNDYKNHGRNKNSQNYDPSNNCYACELLMISLNIIFDENNSEEEFRELLNLFLEQIDDMSTGLCPLGRIIRLVQFILTTRREKFFPDNVVFLDKDLISSIYE